LINEYSEFVVIDEKVNNLWPSLGLSASLVVEAIEQNKVLEKVAFLIEGLRRKGMTRKSTLLAIGGGIIQDISTFTASSYMRGVEWVYAPTTLLGMVDSCIGGKSSINVGEFKNIAGNFYPPEKIVIDVNFCKTLTEQQLVDGLCESAKICYAHSEVKFNEYLCNINSDIKLRDFDFESIVLLSLKAKKEFIEEDEFDNGIRLLLNFGHTFGHAIEGASHFKISHGVAVGLGIFSAFKLSELLGLISDKPQIVSSLLKHLGQILSRVEGLNEIINTLPIQSALDNFKSDKKHDSTNYFAILFDESGRLMRHGFEKSDKNDLHILEALEFLKENPYEI
jgi:3-dehydroquinate synthase